MTSIAIFSGLPFQEVDLQPTSGTLRIPLDFFDRLPDDIDSRNASFELLPEELLVDHPFERARLQSIPRCEDFRSRID